MSSNILLCSCLLSYFILLMILSFSYPSEPLCCVVTRRISIAIMTFLRRSWDIRRSQCDVDEAQKKRKKKIRTRSFLAANCFLSCWASFEMSEFPKCLVCLNPSEEFHQIPFHVSMNVIFLLGGCGVVFENQGKKYFVNPFYLTTLWAIFVILILCLRFFWNLHI